MDMAHSRVVGQSTERLYPGKPARCMVAVTQFEIGSLRSRSRQWLDVDRPEYSLRSSREALPYVSALAIRVARESLSFPPHRAVRCPFMTHPVADHIAERFIENGLGLAAVTVVLDLILILQVCRLA